MGFPSQITPKDTKTLGQFFALSPPAWLCWEERRAPSTLKRSLSAEHEQPAQATGPKHCCTDLVPAPGPCGPPESLENPTIVCLKHTCMLKKKNMTCPAEKELLPSINKGPRISQQVDFQRTQLFVPPTEVETGLKKLLISETIHYACMCSIFLSIFTIPLHFHYGKEVRRGIKVFYL